MNSSMMTPQPQPVEVMEKNKKPLIGLPASGASNERRFPLTPEAVEILVAQGYKVKIEENAGSCIRYSDVQYIKAGAEITDRKDAFDCDIVIYLPEITTMEVKMMKRGAVLMSLFHAGDNCAGILNELLRRNIIYLAIDLITDNEGNTPFADILAEIDGRAIAALGASMLMDAGFGKGILLGGVSGIVPCEVTIIGSGIAACAAASSAIGLGATVRMFDNDIYRLRRARQTTGDALITSALHPRVLLNALRSADIVVSTPTANPCVINADDINVMKQGVVIMDINSEKFHTFPSLPHIEITSGIPHKDSRSGRVCFTSVGNAVPRTAAMALSNTFVAMFDEMKQYDGMINCVKMSGSIQNATITFFGKLVNHRAARKAGMRAIDIHILLNCS
ncbi:MAG: hypothetical protein NC248_11950 [Bacteroides sp.]|nr:hypothetical protein [Bacteroides sp.]MCM1389982.1 hypothetical protein [Bacteroides sp.]